jgi:glycosyltransferase involved in cell wall biosynthesis
MSGRRVPNAAAEPLVTVAIPTFNRAVWLKQSVISALRQTYRNLEVLVSDNASTDETPEVLEELTNQKLRVIRQKTNIGLLPNWNACLAAAKGEYIVFVSDDDRIEPWMLERCVTLIKRDPQIPIVIALARSMALDRTLPILASRRLGTGIWNGSDILIEYLNDAIGIHMCSIMIETAALRARGGFPIDFPHASDVAAWAPLLFMGKAGLVNEFCATCRSHSDSETFRLPVEKLIEDGWKVVDLISRHADRSVVRSAERSRIKLEAKRCFARRAISILFRYRDNGGNKSDMAVMVWRFWRNVGHVGLANIFDLAKLTAIILFPEPVTDWMRRLKRAWVGNS